MLIEVLISAVLIALIVIAMFNGFDVTNRASAAERARAQANALAQQAEDKLRSLPLSALETLEATPLIEKVTQNKTEYTITSTAQYVSDATATSSCSSSATSASYLRTSSSVTWGSIGTRKPVIQSNIISPPPGSALIAQVTNGAGEAVAGMNVTAAGPAPSAAEHTLATASTGCAILSLFPGEYNINVSKAGYIDQNWYAESAKDPASTHSIYLTAESAAKEPFNFAQPGALEAEFTTEGLTSEGDSFVAFNSLMDHPAFRSIGTLETYVKKVKSATTVYPFPASAPYSVYAGSCEANNPVAVNPKNSAPTKATVKTGITTVAKVVQPPINIRVMSGTKAGAATEGLKIENATGTLAEPAEPNGCGITHKFTTTKEGALPHPGMPFAEYTLCVTGGISGGNNGATKGLAANRKYIRTFENDTTAGPSALATMTNGGVITESGKKIAVIYMGAGAATSPGELTEGTACP